AFAVPRRSIPLNAPVVLSNGALVYDYDAGRTLCVTPLSEGYLPLCRAARKAFPQVAAEAHLRAGVWVAGNNPSSEAHLKNVHVKGTVVDSPDDIPPDWLKIVFTAAHRDLEALRDWLQPRLGGVFELMFSHPNLLELQDARAGKGEGAAQLADLLGIASRDIYCAGDQQNDLSMLRRFYAFAPQNAEAEVKAVSQEIGPDCDEHFIAWVVRRLEERYR
ncbi:MAG: HAD hydrolase family protein, partial [Oscillospiraceae bacterium]|nr:HAD hydrolase family protein [Oscillospiraceae bacterium]